MNFARKPPTLPSSGIRPGVGLTCSLLGAEGHPEGHPALCSSLPAQAAVTQGIPPSSHALDCSSCRCFHTPSKGVRLWVLEIMQRECSPLTSDLAASDPVDCLLPSPALTLCRGVPSRFSVLWGLLKSTFCLNLVHLEICGELSVGNPNCVWECIPTGLTVNITSVYHPTVSISLTSSPDRSKLANNFTANLRNFPNINLNEHSCTKFAVDGSG